MKRKLLKIALAVSVIFVLFLMSGCDDSSKSKNQLYDVSVILRECEGMTILSDEVMQTVKAGENVKFEIQIDEDYYYLGNTAGATYNEKMGTIRISRVHFPTTIDLILVPKSELYKIEVGQNLDYGYIQFIEGDEYMQYATPVTLKANYFSGYTFDGWSFDKFAYEGGKIVSTDTTYTFTPTDRTTKIYANYSNKQGYTIIYNANGGTVAGTESETYMVSGDFSSQFAMQQTLNANSEEAEFIREGYQAIGYSTTPTDYSQVSTVNAIEGFSNMGGVCQVGASGKLDLYVVWAKETDIGDFTLVEQRLVILSRDGKVNEDEKYKTKSIYGYFIKKYNGSDKTVVIPEEHNGLRIIGIMANAFSGNLERVVIPKSVYEIQSSAFSSCRYLREVIFFDSLQNVTNSSFPSNVKTVVLNAQQLPVYANSAEGCFCIKYERVRTLTKKKLIVMSGSSTLNGLDSAQMEKNFNGEYAVVNYGTNAGTQMAFYLDAITKYISEGDLVILAPEWTSDGPMGGHKLHWKMFRGNNQCYDLFREVDMTRYTNFWGAYCTFMTDGEGSPAALRSTSAYQVPCSSLNEYGDLSTNRPGPTYTPNPTSRFNMTIFDGDKATMLNRINASIKSKGGTLLFSFGTVDYDAMNPEYTTQQKCDEFTQYCASRLDFPVISNVRTYMIPHELMHNSAWHCSNAGAAQRTDDLTNDIKKYLKEEGKIDTDISFDGPAIPDYTLKNGEYALIYFSNGGKIKGSEEEVYVDINTFNSSFAMQNTLEANNAKTDFFVRTILL